MSGELRAGCGRQAGGALVAGERLTARWLRMASGRLEDGARAGDDRQATSRAAVGELRAVSRATNWRAISDHAGFPAHVVKNRSKKDAFVFDRCVSRRSVPGFGITPAQNHGTNLLHVHLSFFERFLTTSTKNLALRWAAAVYGTPGPQGGSSVRPAGGVRRPRRKVLRRPAAARTSPGAPQRPKARPTHWAPRRPPRSELCRPRPPQAGACGRT